MSESLYCPKCNNYLMAGDGKCHDCPCGWTQSRDDESDEYWSAEVSALEDSVSQLQSRNRQLADLVSDLEAERDALRAQVEVMRGALERAREVVAFHHVTAGDRFREVELAAIDAALQVEP